MGRHSFRQLKVKGTRKVNSPRKDISESEKKQNKIKVLQRYRNTIENANIEELPKYINSFYSYIIKKEIISNDEYIKNELLSQIETIIDSYRNNYDSNEIFKIRYNLKEELKKSYNLNKKTSKQEDYIKSLNILTLFFKSNFFAMKHFIEKFTIS